MPAKYYVLARTLWQGDNWQAIAGPFNDKDKAESVAAENSNNGFNNYGLQNLKHVVKTIVVNTTQMKRGYGISKKRATENIIYIEQYDNGLTV